MLSTEMVSFSLAQEGFVRRVLDASKIISKMEYVAKDSNLVTVLICIIFKKSKVVHPYTYVSVTVRHGIHDKLERSLIIVLDFSVFVF